MTTEHTQPSRRQVLTAGGAAVAIPLLAACGGSGSSQQPQQPGQSASGGAGGRLTAVSDVPVGSGVVVQSPSGEPVVVAQPQQGTVRAFSAVCTHQGCTVAVKGDELDCPCHGSRFATASGEVLQGPAQRPLPEVKVKVEGADVVLA
ncbi:ubiquinol-cytochrome c reductase iron-sulfur subunit [Georgenia thermotolerans]|uniref:Cytochrome bc1 complex Rieske iron-sulfur subunit n=1 Tax=Georgenia thermotolerans TaxID=527326 RepID=A0A7J5UTW2_9MICO|nr:Rieske (2Fe-2S) protein [Georgenia thermotolerans]KAE8765700.1 Rieske 2Fe-2S domain-containing protein [Georgenia thermotolerans]